ncbi:MAG TPA: hypothetical protein VLS47_00420 [Gallionella sp.]|nr:hypothetical protein [Gallionella sp.]
MNETIVSMHFRLQPGRNVQDWLKANEQVNGWAQRQPGFHYRSLSETGDGEWIIISYWGSAQAAEAADKRFAPEMGGVVFPFVDMNSFRVTRSTARLLQPGEPAGVQA